MMMVSGTSVYILSVIFLIQQAMAAIPEYFVDEHCSQTLALNYGSVETVKLRLTKASKYPDGMRCAMRIQAPEGKRLVVRIEYFDINGAQEALCQGGDYMQFFDGPTESSIIHPELPATVCQKPLVDHISTSGRFLVMRFVSNTDLISGKGVKLTITAFSEAPCSQDEFRCKSTSHCIQRSLQCDKLASCPDATDERMPDCLSTGAIAGISVACVVIVAAIVISVVVCCIVRERKKRARIIKRAMEHQFKQQVYATSNFLWEQSQHAGTDALWTGRIDSSKIDPIWDGTVETSKIYPAWNKHLSICKVEPIMGNGISLLDNLDRETKHNQEYDTCGEESKMFDPDESKNETKINNPHGGQMKKVPSGFWEIDLSELGIDIPMASIPPLTVL